MSSDGQTRNVVFVVNPKAGTHSKSSIIDQINRCLDKSIIDHTILYTESPGHGYQIAKEAVRSQVTAVIAVGGDGTMNECASALINSSTSLGLVPIGSGNGLARDLGYSMNIRQSVEVINRGNEIIIDCGLANDRYFFCTAGIGFDAEVSKKFQDQSIRGFQGYIKTALRELVSYQCQIYDIMFDESEIQVKAFSVTFANVCQFGNNAYISPEADPSDGLIDLCIVKEFPKHHAPVMVTRLFTRSIHKSPYTIIHRAKKVRITCPDQSHFHLDGEAIDLSGKHLNIRIVPKALKVLVP